MWEWERIQYRIGLRPGQQGPRQVLRQLGTYRKVGYRVDKVLQNKDIKILWDFKIQTDKHLARNIPDITVVEKKRVWIIDVAIPGTHNFLCWSKLS